MDTTESLGYLKGLIEGLDLGELYDATNGVHWVPPLLDWYPLKSMDTDPCCGTMPMSLALSGRFATN